jgi:hypothetical protein
MASSCHAVAVGRSDVAGGFGQGHRVHGESVAGDRLAVVGAQALYEEPGGSVSVVSSADVLEFDGAGQVTTITSYAVELDA